ncbi:acyl-CoA dehydrogenase family protein [Bradyrhizobium sp. CB1015]|uniref:acyl-CoA dehydrogenase family protein n=1 Tax=Bradyrhizobium sp. CB1015 TaxID=2976822 RepID=UPI0021AA618D|nr:acyl-CoA dehydrogenase family protein [Bradyrhizobium sp. CB1015]UWU95639.1 acyl-CoA dehydrogenase family protein [Bradyrhizobium sp. CB1015]
MIDFSIPEETRLLVDTVRRFVETEVQPLEDVVEQTATVPSEALAVTKAKAQKLGLYAMNMPADVGGGGLTCVEHCLVEEEFGKTSDALIRRVFGQVYPMLMACKGNQVERYLLPTVKGDKICAMAITEPGAGSDAASISTTAHLDGDEWVLNGTKHFISDGDIADYIILMALTDKDKRARGGITLFLVDRATAGFKVARTQPMMGHRGYGHAELSFEDCRIPKAAVLGEVGGGFKLIMQSVLQIRLAHIGARAVGMAQRALEMMRRHAGERRQFGQLIGDFQMVQKLIADSATEIFGVKMMVMNAAWDIDQGKDARDKVSMIKVAASEMQGRVVDRAIQVFGGMGFSKDLPLERMYRDARVTRIYDGTSEIHRMLVARSTIKNGLQL